jgi:hypothetical protein
VWWLKQPEDFMQTDLKQLKTDLMDIRRRVAIFVAETEGAERTQALGEVKMWIDAISGIAWQAQKRDRPDRTQDRKTIK